MWEIQFVEVDLFHQIEKIEKIKLEFLIYQALNRSRSSNIGFSENIFLFLGSDPEKCICCLETDQITATDWSSRRQSFKLCNFLTEIAIILKGNIEKIFYTLYFNSLRIRIRICPCHQGLIKTFKKQLINQTF